MLTAFIESSKKQNKIDPREFWEFREFYAPGILTVQKNTVSTPFLVFQSDKIISRESLIFLKEKQKLWPPSTSNGIQPYFLSKNDIIFKDNGLIRIVFLKPVEEMIRANAVYDYKDKDKKFLENKLWYVETTVKP